MDSNKGTGANIDEGVGSDIDADADVDESAGFVHMHEEEHGSDCGGAAVACGHDVGC